MLCQKCGDFEFYFDIEDYFCKSILFEPLNYFSGVAVENEGTSNLICDECGEEILVGDLYLEDESAVERSKELIFFEMAKVVMRNIEACEECGHGRHMQELHHSIRSTFDEEDDNPEEIFSRLHKSTELAELIGEVTGFDDAYYEDIVKYIHCPHCMNGSGANYEDKTDYGHFELSTEVYTKEDINYFENKFYDEAFDMPYLIMKRTRILRLLKFTPVNTARILKVTFRAADVTG
ncbi:MAG: hypothetical protein Q8930_19690 [Bacillota bacterium]|nr:hypothetical protein [Bacillota bacterium]